jgi:hypothetical protein
MSQRVARMRAPVTGSATSGVGWLPAYRCAHAGYLLLATCYLLRSILTLYFQLPLQSKQRIELLASLKIKCLALP